MSKFNKTGAVKATGKGPIVTNRTSDGKTALGGPGFSRDAKSELFLLAVANMVSEKTFHEQVSDRDNRYNKLVRSVAVSDPKWFTAFVGWLRGREANMRSASIVAAAEGVHALLEAKVDVPKRGIIASVLQRADEPGEMLGYWITKFGRNVPKPVKRGVSDAIQRLYNEYGSLKYDTQSSDLRFADVLAITHAEPVAAWQGDLFAWLNARRWDRLDGFPLSESLPMIGARTRADLLDRDAVLADTELIAAAGYTWENIAGKGKMDARAWEAVIPNMGYMALLRNLRNFDQAGISDVSVELVRAKLSDPEQVRKSRQFPFRFLSAYQATRSENWGREVEKALNTSLENVPTLTGNTLVLVDRSGSMFGSAGGSLSDMSRADVAALFGVALASRSEKSDLVQFGSSWSKVDVRKGDSVLKSISKFGDLGGTNTQGALAANFKPGVHTRIVIITDEQAGGFGGYWGSREPVGTGVPETVPMYTWNLAGYQMGHAAGGPNRHVFGGLTDTAFRMIPLLEAGRNADWPFTVQE